MSLEERIERLERTNRRYRRMFALLGVITVCTVGISATQDDPVPDVIRAKEFRLVDDAGTTWGSIYSSENEGATIDLYRPVELDPKLPIRTPSVKIRSNSFGAGSIDLGTGVFGDDYRVTLEAQDGVGAVGVRGGDDDNQVVMVANKEGKGGRIIVGGLDGAIHLAANDRTSEIIVTQGRGLDSRVVMSVDGESKGGRITIGGLGSGIFLTSDDRASDIRVTQRGDHVFLTASEDVTAVQIFKGSALLAMIGTTKEGDSTFGAVTVLNSEKKVLCGMGPNAGGNGGQINVYGDNQETSCLALAAGKDGNGLILVSDQQGNGLVAVGGRPRENGVESYLALSGADNRLLVLLRAASDARSGAMSFYGPEGEVPFVDIGATSDGGKMTVFNKTGEGVCAFGVDEYGNGVVIAADRNGKTRTLKPGP